MALNETESNLDSEIRRVFAEVFSGHKPGADVPALEADTVLLETGLDSLGFAILVTRLEEELGFDPFTLADEPFYPRTYGEFLSFYGAHAPG